MLRRGQETSMYVLIIVGMMVEVTGPQFVTRPKIEYYQSKEHCQQYGIKHIKEFMASLPKEPLLFAAKCVEIGEMDGVPA